MQADTGRMRATQSKTETAARRWRREGGASLTKDMDKGRKASERASLDSSVLGPLFVPGPLSPCMRCFALMLRVHMMCLSSCPERVPSATSLSVHDGELQRRAFPHDSGLV